MTPHGSAPDPADLLRSRDYLRLLGLAALVGLPISAAAYGFLSLVHLVQEWVFDDLPRAAGFGAVPAWWPLPVLIVAGVLVGCAIRFLPGTGGHVPVEGLQTSTPVVAALPGIFAAALAGLGLGVVLGPEAPLIALGGGLAVLALGRGSSRRPPQVVSMVGAIGSFAAIATLLGSPIVGAFLLMEAIGIGGPLLGAVLIPGLLAAGIGTLIFVGLGNWTGLGPLSLGVPDLPAVGTTTVPEFGWAIAIGVLGAFVGTAIRRAGKRLEPVARDHVLLVTPTAGAVIGALAIIYAQQTGHSTKDVLFSGQDQLGPLLVGHANYSAGTLALLLLCKGLAYCAALGSFRGGPIFPSMFLGAAGGLLLSHLPGLPPVVGAAMGIVALATTMLRLPITAVLLTTLFLGEDGLRLMPVIIVAGVVAYVVSARLDPPETPTPAMAST